MLDMSIGGIDTASRIDGSSITRRTAAGNPPVADSADARDRIAPAGPVSTDRRTCRSAAPSTDRPTVRMTVPGHSWDIRAAARKADRGVRGNDHHHAHHPGRHHRLPGPFLPRPDRRRRRRRRARRRRDRRRPGPGPGHRRPAAVGRRLRCRPHTPRPSSRTGCPRSRRPRRDAGPDGAVGRGRDAAARAGASSTTTRVRSPAR